MLAAVPVSTSNLSENIEKSQATEEFCLWHLRVRQRTDDRTEDDGEGVVVGGGDAEPAHHERGVAVAELEQPGDAAHAVDLVRCDRGAGVG